MMTHGFQSDACLVLQDASIPPVLAKRWQRACERADALSLPQWWAATPHQACPEILICLDLERWAERGQTLQGDHRRLLVRQLHVRGCCSP
eukprot:4363103-Amphidinium_carterae.1